MKRLHVLTAVAAASLPDLYRLHRLTMYPLVLRNTFPRAYRGKITLGPGRSASRRVGHGRCKQAGRSYDGQQAGAEREDNG